jgi:hypothetical protein
MGYEQERDRIGASGIGERGGVLSNLEVHRPETPIDLKGWLNHELHMAK